MTTRDRCSGAGVSQREAIRSVLKSPVLTLPVVQPVRPMVPCKECALCCTYVAVGIDAPTTVKRATDILWFLYHEKVSVFRAVEGGWYVQFETRCRNLTGDRMCGIYEQRPHQCREFDETACEVNATDEGKYFHTPMEFLEYMERRRKKLYRVLVRKYVAPDQVLGARRNGNGQDDQAP